jgi:DNA-binding GntR family transcriptional regulator
MVKKALPPADNGMIRRSISEQVALYIRRLIFDGELRPGTRVPQEEIAQTLGISRIPIREALIALEREGWVTVEMHRGAFITAINAQAVRDHYELYGLVYAFAARRALDRGDSQWVAQLSDIAAKIAAAEDPVEMGQLSVDFQATVVEAANSPRIKVVLRAMSALIPGAFFSEVPEAMEIQRRGLASIVRALRRGDGDRASEEYMRVMRRMGDKVVQVFKERGLFDAVG